MKTLFSSAWRDVRELIGDGAGVRRGLSLLAAACFIAQLVVLGTFLDRSAQPGPIVASTDNDAGIAVYTAIKTKLYNDNGWRPYGPAYYRLTRIIHDIAHPAVSADSKLTPVQANERNHHFFLMLVSALSLGGLALLLVSALTPDWIFRFLGASLLLGAFLRSQVWTSMVFHAHPDHLLGAAVGLATLCTWQALRLSRDDKRFKLAAAAWGFVASVKMAVTMFVPSILLFILPLEKRDRTTALLFKRIRLFIGYALLVYLVVGFPQSFNFGGVLSFLLQQRRNVITGDFEFLKIWIELFATQLWQPALVLFALALVSPLELKLIEAADRKIALRFAAFVILPVLLIWTRRITSVYTYYPIPFIAALLAGFVPLLVWLGSRLRFLAPVRRSIWTPAVLLLLTPLWQGATPTTLQAELMLEKKCRSEATVVEALVDAEAAKGSHILADPFIPYARVYHDKQVQMAWVMGADLIQPEKTTMIAIKNTYYVAYLDPSEGGNGSVVDHVENLERTRAFYRLFHNHTEAVDPHGQKWEKIHDDQCGFEIWKRPGT